MIDLALVTRLATQSNVALVAADSLAERTAKYTVQLVAVEHDDGFGFGFGPTGFTPMKLIEESATFRNQALLSKSVVMSLRYGVSRFTDVTT